MQKSPDQNVLDKMLQCNCNEPKPSYEFNVLHNQVSQTNFNKNESFIQSSLQQCAEEDRDLQELNLIKQQIQEAKQRLASLKDLEASLEKEVKQSLKGEEYHRNQLNILLQLEFDE